MKLSNFDYNLPKELIAQFPAEPRGSSRLLVLNRKTQSIQHKSFSDLPDYIEQEDTLVLNDTKVYPARLYGINTRNSKEIELLLLREEKEAVFKCLAKPSKHINTGDRLIFKDKRITAEVLGREKFLEVKFHCAPLENLRNIIWEIGEMPLPPYIKRDTVKNDSETYQTIYAKSEGAVAAPTAGLHFTESLLRKVKNSGAKLTYLTLHTGYGTFSPVREDDVKQHKMHAEYFSISEESASLINETKKKGNRIFAVGTTTCRALESAVVNGRLEAKEGETEIFIYPPYDFKIVNAVVTNFHLPKTTLLMMISAFCQGNSSDIKDGVKFLMNAYEEAVREKYRFYSYGDAMLII
ncbi:MAG: tRNA preQ1(34) S-adenosylmethionine ribosyltransferase-isomerase QueA [Candidatus Omnitrophota bacterium]